jgi:hypothetical protein
MALPNFRRWQADGLATCLLLTNRPVNYIDE